MRTRLGGWLATLTLIGVGGISACGDGRPSEKRSAAELLAIGDSRLDEIGVPAEWEATTGNIAEKRQAKLRWERDYEAYESPAETVREMDKRITTLGWERRLTCDNGQGIPCWTYVKGGLTIWPAVTDVSPCAGHPVCTKLLLTMTENFAAPI